MLKSMREWLMDCDWRDLDADQIEELEDWRIINAVGRHWDGGLTEYVREYMHALRVSGKLAPRGWTHV